MNIDTITAASRIQAAATGASREGTARPASGSDAAARRRQEEAEPKPPPAKAPALDLELPELKDYTLSFRYEDDLNRIIVNVIDPETKEVIRSFPPEEIIRALKQAAEAHGNLIDEQV